MLYGPSRAFNDFFATGRSRLERAPDRDDEKKKKNVFVTAYRHGASRRSIETRVGAFTFEGQEGYAYSFDGGTLPWMS